MTRVSRGTLHFSAIIARKWATARITLRPGIFPAIHGSLSGGKWRIWFPQSNFLRRPFHAVAGRPGLHRPSPLYHPMLLHGDVFVGRGHDDVVHHLDAHELADLP